ncbi:MAG TPA: hypothetical protein VK988_00785 [Acidimicrobiales bacterium]|nr:hypothetical protein [Acidimicrobiales bacterium]
MTERTNEYFTVDRVGTLSPSTIQLERWEDIEPTELKVHVHEVFPDGLSRHGEQYLLQASSAGSALEPNLELLWEYARRTFAPDAPSRFQSLFAFERFEDAQEFEAEFGQARAVWTVRSCHQPFRTDMRWLRLTGSALMVSHAAMSYWRQASTAELPLALGPRRPLWEVLLLLPVDVLERVA